MNSTTFGKNYIHVINFLFLLIVSSPALTQQSESIVMVSAEQTGIFNTGGLGHTVYGLGNALKKSGKNIEIVMPFYADIESDTLKKVKKTEHPPIEFRWGDLPGSPEVRFEIYSYQNDLTGLNTILLKEVSGLGLFDNVRKEGTGKKYTHFPSEGMAFAIFNKAAAEWIHRGKYQTVNLHDWHTGFTGYYLRMRAAIQPTTELKVLFTISNFGYQGVFPIESLGDGKPAMKEFTSEKYEFYGQANFMKAGIIDSDMVLTVSKNYLKEIFQPRFAGGLEGFLEAESQKRPFTAITNGADLSAWTPSDFNSTDISAKRMGKDSLLRAIGLGDRVSEPLFVMTSRLANQKGYDYLPEAFDRYFANNTSGTLIILGDGEQRYLDKVLELKNKFPDRIVYKSFDSALEKRVTFYSDFFVNGAWYEPSGTNQMFAMKAGTIPILSRVGGLPEYIVPGETGFLVDIVYEHNHIDIGRTAANFAEVFRNVSQLYVSDPKKLSEMVRGTMQVDHSWDNKVPEYNNLFNRLESSPSVRARFGYPCHDVEMGVGGGL